MPFSSLAKLIPKEYPSRNREYIKGKLDGLEVKCRNLRVLSGNCDIEPSMFKGNRKNLVAAVRSKFPNSMILLKGNETTPSRYCERQPFRQDSDFYWTFGVSEPNFWGAIDVQTNTSYLFYDSYLNGEKITSEVCSDPNGVAKEYMIDKVISSIEMKYEITMLGRNIFLVLEDMREETFKNMKSDGIHRVLADCGAWICNTVLSPIIRDCRLIKSKEEEAIMRATARINNEAITFVLHNLQSGISGNCAAAMFSLYVTSAHRHAREARRPSCLSGDNTVCVNPDRAQFSMSDTLMEGQLCLMDMGVEMHGYHTNVVATAPTSGVFTREQQLIYTIVLEVKEAMLTVLKPGIAIAELETIAQRKMVELMLANGLLLGAKENIIESGICEVFRPNGLGHFLGVDFYEGERIVSNERGVIKTDYFYNQIARPGMILALNSEFYINEIAIKSRINGKGGEYLQLPHLVKFFGIAARVQDIVLITSNSYEVLSSIPRSIKELSVIIIGKDKINFSISDRSEIITKPQVKKSIQKMSSEKKMKLRERKRKRINDKFDKISGYTDLSPANESTVDLDKVLEVLMALRGSPRLGHRDEVKTLIHKSPHKPMLLLPSIPARINPKLLPFPDQFKSTVPFDFPREGYGCPYFDWVENIVTCEEKEEFCKGLDENLGHNSQDTFSSGKDIFEATN